MKEHDALKARIDALGQRLDAKIRQYESRGEFSDVHKAFTADVKRRQRVLQDKVDDALRQGKSWDAAKTELEREFTGVSEDMLRWEERLDAAAVRRNS